MQDVAQLDMDMKYVVPATRRYDVIVRAIEIVTAGFRYPIVEYGYLTHIKPMVVLGEIDFSLTRTKPQTLDGIQKSDFLTETVRKATGPDCRFAVRRKVVCGEQ